MCNCGTSEAVVEAHLHVVATPSVVPSTWYTMVQLTI